MNLVIMKITREEPDGWMRVYRAEKTDNGPEVLTHLASSDNLDDILAVVRSELT